MIGDKFTVNNTEYVIQKNTWDQLQILFDSLNQILGLEQKELDKLSLPDAVNIYAQAFLSLTISNVERKQCIIKSQKMAELEMKEKEIQANRG